jgi:hypothetical protein
MNCKCGEKCFFYQKFNSKEGIRVITEVNKCARLSDPKYANPKKKKCDFYSEVEINSIAVNEKKCEDKIKSISRKIDHMTELKKNIELYKNCIENGNNFKKYRARIDYHLDALNYNHFNYGDETYKELLKRIENGPDRINYRTINCTKSIITHSLLPIVRKSNKIKQVIKRQPKKVETKSVSKIDFDKLSKDELENKESDKKDSKIFIEENSDSEEETELRDHFNDEKEEEEEKCEYIGGLSENDDDDDGGDFSD